MKILTSLFTICLAAAVQAQENSYLEIPLEGRLGEQVTARGVEDALDAARALGAKHIVFTIDSSGGDPLAALDLHALLSTRNRDFTFHALVREAAGVAVMPLVWCETILIRPGGRIGGMDLGAEASRYPGVEPGVVVLNLALNAAEEAKRHGRSPELVRALLDPGQPVNGWRDGAGRIQIGSGIPNGIHTDDFIVQHPAGSVLTLTDRQAVELRFARAYDGDAAGMGRELGYAGWATKGEAGRKALAHATVAERVKSSLLRNDRQRFLIDQNRRRRTAAKLSIERFLNLGHEWNPKLGTYSTYKETWPWWNTFWDGCGVDTGRLTPEARQKWRDRTDLTVALLSRARGGVLEMKLLDKEARELGQEPFYPEGKLEEMRVDLELKIAMLIRERDRRFKDD